MLAWECHKYTIKCLQDLVRLARFGWCRGTWECVCVRGGGGEAEQGGAEAGQTCGQTGLGRVWRLDLALMSYPNSRPQATQS